MIYSKEFEGRESR